jgi:hypothetical protein
MYIYTAAKKGHAICKKPNRLGVCMAGREKGFDPIEVGDEWRFWACVDLARVVSAFVVFANRPLKLIGLCKAAPKPFRNI